MADSSLLQHLTVVIPSYERQRFLLRQIDYWQDKNVTVIILDGSKNSLSIGGGSPANIHYWHMPDTIERRLHFCATHIKTKYAVLLSDDEFYLPSGLLTCLRKLEQHPGVVACKGVAMGFDFSDGRVSGYDIYPKLRSSASLHQSTPRERMVHHMRPYVMTTLWAVTRTDVFMSSLRAIATGPYSTAAAAEMQISLMAAFHGQCHVVDELMWMRSFENRNIWWEAGNKSFADWYMDEGNVEEISRFTRAMVDEIPPQSRDEVIDWIQDALEQYVLHCTLPPPRSGFRSFAEKLPQPILKFIKRIYRKYLRADVGPKSSPYSIADQFEKDGIAVDREGLNDVVRRVCLFHGYNRKMDCA